MTFDLAGTGWKYLADQFSTGLANPMMGPVHLGFNLCDVVGFCGFAQYLIDLISITPFHCFVTVD